MLNNKNILILVEQVLLAKHLSYLLSKYPKIKN